ncbi:MAG TPA: hypothetical protein VN688_33760 [Gemmataceae bacterium]|nr:hypothetical protein [Gemmataceae bacterium]
MRKMTRRAALGGLSGAGFVSLLGTLSPTATADEGKAQRSELFVVGPFNLGDWFRKAKPRIEGLFNVGSPDRNEIAKSLSKCTLFIIDERVWKDPKKVRFADDGPRLVAAGKLHHVWKDNKKAFTIQIGDLKAASDKIDYDAVPPHQRVTVSVDLVTAGKAGVGYSSSTFSIMPEKPYFYDINGKLRRV